VGAELDGVQAGISIPEAPAIKERLGLDYYLAGVHGLDEGVTDAQSFVDDHHRRLMGIVNNPAVDVVAHPWCGGHSYARRGRIEGWRFEYIPEPFLVEFIDAALHAGKAIELNPKALEDAGEPAFQHYLELLRRSGVPVTVGSDAHSMERVGVERQIALLQEAGFGPERLWSPARG
jgi:histidinol phosphatase-like PHP family hydrolase